MRKYPKITRKCAAVDGASVIRIAPTTVLSVDKASDSLANRAACTVLTGPEAFCRISRCVECQFVSF